MMQYVTSLTLFDDLQPDKFFLIIICSVSDSNTKPKGTVDTESIQD